MVFSRRAPISRRALILCVAFGALVVCASMSWAQAPVRDFKPREIKSAAVQPEAWQILSMANRARAEAGVAPLEWDPALAGAARQHCLRMAAEGPVSHRYANEPSLEQRAAQAGARFSLIEENVAFGPTTDAIHNSWMRSPDHRANLLSPDVNHVGVAVVAGRGKLYAVADYDRAVPALTESQVEAAIAGLLSSTGIGLHRDSADARLACAHDKEVKFSHEPSFLMLWQGTDVTHLPKALTDKIATGQYSEAAVGSCPAQSVNSAFTAYRVAVLLY